MGIEIRWITDKILILDFTNLNVIKVVYVLAVRGSLNFKCHLLQDEEEDVFKRDFSAPTLEDHFNKTILPKVMQVSLVTAPEAQALTMTLNSRSYSTILLFHVPSSPLTFTPSPSVIRSKTLVGLGVPSTLTWWTRTPHHLTLLGPRRAPRTASSLSRRQQA